MKTKRFFITLAAAIALACDPVEMIEKPETPEDVTPKEKPELKSPQMMWTALSYPEGYDWIKDQMYGLVDCELIFAGEDAEHLRKKVGAEYLTLADSYMHHIAGGDLYEDYCTDNQTVILKNGEELYRWDGQDVVVDMMLHEGILHILASSRTDSTYKYIKNGNICVHDDATGPASGFYLDDDVVCFTCAAKSIWNSNCIAWTLRRGDNIMPMTNPSSDEVIGDVRFVGGKPYAILLGEPRTRLVKGDEVVELESLFNTAIKDPQILYDGGNVYIEGWQTFCTVPQSKFYILWKNGKPVHFGVDIFEKRRSVIEGNDLCTLGYRPRLECYSVLRNLEYIDIPSEYRPAPGAPMAILNGVLWISLVDKNNRPVLWKNGEIIKFNFNGYIDNLAVGERVFSTTDGYHR